MLLLVKGERLIANTHAALDEGSAVTLKVEKASPDPILKLMKIEGENVDVVNTSIILNGIERNLWKTIIENLDQSSLPIKEKELLKELVRDTSEKFFSKPSPDMLAELLNKSGLFWENKIREYLTSRNPQSINIQELLTGDLKGLISKLMTSESGKSEHFTRFFSMIQNVQLLNHFGFDQDGKIFIPLPLQLADGYFTVGQLLIHSDQHKNGRGRQTAVKNGSFRVSFLLELSSLGPLRADLAIHDKQITGRFLTIKIETKHILEKYLPSLIDALSDKGFSISHLECHVREPKLVNDTLIKEIIPEESCNISLVA